MDILRISVKHALGILINVKIIDCNWYEAMGISSAQLNECVCVHRAHTRNVLMTRMRPCLGEPVEGQDRLTSGVHIYIQPEGYRNGIVIAGENRRVCHRNGRKHCFQHLQWILSLVQMRRVRHGPPFNALSIHKDIATIAHVAGFNSRHLGLLSVGGII